MLFEESDLLKELPEYQLIQKLQVNLDTKTHLLMSIHL